MKKFLIFITLVAILLACATLAVNAEEVATEGEVIEETVEEAPITAVVVKDLILANLDKICSAISVVMCGILAWLYKKGFLPYLSNGLKQLGGALSATKDGLTKVVDANREDVTKAVEAFDKGVNAINDMAVKFEELQKLYKVQEANQAKLEAKIKRSDEINLLLSNMIWKIFINTNMAQYLKDEMNTTYANCMSYIKTLEEEAATDNETNI